MPFKATTPFLESQEYNVFRVSNLTISTPRDKIGTDSIVIRLESGYDSGSEEIIWLKNKPIQILGTDLQSLMSQTTSGGTFYDEIKGTILQYLIDKGEVPADTVDLE